MTREEFQQRRRYGLKQRHARRLINANTPACDGCSGSLAACETREWLSGRRCCPECTHSTTPPEDVA